MEKMTKNLEDYLTDKSWKKLLKEEFAKDYMQALQDKLRLEYQEKIIYPKPSDIFSAFNLTSFDKVKVVIIGQDPYHGPDQAHGLCFSVQPQIKIPPSLANVYKEIESDLGIKMPPHGHLKSWAEQGALLLNSILTVENGNPMAHKKLGWEVFTDHVIDLIKEKKENVVFMLWGSFAQKKGAKIDRIKHLVLESGHPSPMSANQGKWFGNKHFSQANAYLKKNNLGMIDWL